MKKLIPLAVASAVLGINTAQAVHVNPDGLGQVLLFPYYTVEGGQDTYINLVNTTDTVKAVKVRFRESMNSDEVLDFNLYLSPFDHWSAVVVVDGEGAAVKTRDTSCTVPLGLSAKLEDSVEGEDGFGDTVAFKNLIYATRDAAPWQGLDRTGEGYVEVIEMGTVTDSVLATASTHTTRANADGDNVRVPTNCGALQAAFQTGQWNRNTGDVNDGLTAGTGGLYGYGVVINVQEGTAASYDATALAAFSGDTIHAFPGDTDPELGDADAFSDVISDNEIIPMNWFASARPGFDAVSSVIMKSAILNDFVLEPDVDAGTDWVITFPTKAEYVNSDPVLAPFTTAWNGTQGQACEEVAIGYWDREEDFIVPEQDDLQFSPRFDPDAPVFELCHEANVLTFNESNVLSASVRSGLNLDVNFDNGWAIIGFDPLDDVGDSLIPARGLTDDGGNEVRGLPVIGFAVQKYVNGELVVDGTTVLSNYAAGTAHKSVVDAETP